MSECLLCERGLREDETARIACRLCQTALAGQLRELPKLYRQLGAGLLPGAGDRGPAVSGSRGHGLPVNEDALDLRAWGGMVSALQAHEDDWRRALGMPVAPFRGSVEQTLTAVVEFLAGHLWWACEKYPDVDGLAEDVRRLRGAALSVVDPEDPATKVRRIGYCPAVYEDGAVCGAVLRHRPGTRSVECRWCGASYPPSSWPELARAQESSGAAC
ncbi:hypothetical protein JBE04_08285 [Streptomyces sp. PRKS01-29]|nr:hypothetical protein [Streptomyces sabulosicollis]MBI0294479.1 hypothetical protein [Streptomyces sabulosicollis]